MSSGASEKYEWLICFVFFFCLPMAFFSWLGLGGADVVYITIAYKSCSEKAQPKGKRKKETRTKLHNSPICFHDSEHGRIGGKSFSLVHDVDKNERLPPWAQRSQQTSPFSL